MVERYELRYAPLFYKDLDEITQYIKGHLKNTQAANNLLEKVMKAIVERSYNPTSYEKYISARNRKEHYYRIYVKNYIVFYVIKGNIMEVRRLLFGKSDFEKYLKF